MWGERLAPLRRLWVDAGRWLGSWRLSVALLPVVASYHLYLAVWAASSPSHVVQRIAGLLPFWLAYLLLLANTGVCLWRRLPTLRRQLAARPYLGERPPDWEVALAEVDPDGAARMLRRLGFRVPSGGAVWGVWRRWEALGSYLFHGALFLLAAGFLLTVAARREASLWVAAGETFEGAPEQFLSSSPPRLLAPQRPPPHFAVEGIEPVFWRDQLLFTELAAHLALPDGRKVTTRINEPLWIGWGTFLRLSGFGYAPRWELLASDGSPRDSAFVKVNVFPPGQRDSFSLGGLPHRVSVAVFPDFAVADGEPATRSLNLVTPAVWARVTRGHLEVAEAVLRRGQALSFEGLALRFPEIRYWGEFALVYDPGAPLIFASYLLALSGLLLKLCGARSEADWQPGEGGAGTLRGWGAGPPAARRLVRAAEARQG